MRNTAWCETNILRKLKRKMWGDMAYYIHTVWKSGGMRSPWPQPNCTHAHEWHNCLAAKSWFYTASLKVACPKKKS